MTATPDEALKLQRRLPDGSLRIVARGVKEDVGSSDGDLTPKTTRLGSTGLAQRNPRSDLAQRNPRSEFFTDEIFGFAKERTRVAANP